MQPKSKKKPRGKPFEVGDPRAGRPKGVPNKASAEAKEVCSALVDDPDYRERLQQRLLDGSLAPGLEQMLWYYAKGKPVEVHSVDVRESPVTIYRIPDNGRDGEN